MFFEKLYNDRCHKLSPNLEGAETTICPVKTPFSPSREVSLPAASIILRASISFCAPEAVSDKPDGARLNRRILR